MRRRNGPNPVNRDNLLTRHVAPIDGRWFTSAMADRQISQRQMAKLMGVDPASIHRLLTGKRPMRMDEAAQIAHLLSLPVADVLEHAGVKLQEGQRMVPIIGYVDGQGEAHLSRDEDAEQIQAPQDLPARAVAVQMRTAASALDSMDGWTLFTTLPDGVSPDAVGRLCLVGLKGNGVTLLRFVRRGYQKGRYNLVHPGLGDLNDAPLDWATPVLHIRP